MDRPDFLEKLRELQKKRTNYNNIYNEGCDGYNPFEDEIRELYSAEQGAIKWKQQMKRK